MYGQFPLSPRRLRSLTLLLPQERLPLLLLMIILKGSSGTPTHRPQKDRLDLLRSMLSANRWLSQVKDIRMSRCANRACDSK